MCSLHATAREKRTALYEWHREWVHRLQAKRPGWPLNEILEMLLLTEGSAIEVDEQLAIWNARTNGLGPGSLRDYQQFLSILHARHQQRIAAGLRDESAEDRDRRMRLEQNEVWKRVDKNGKNGMNGGLP